MALHARRASHWILSFCSRYHSHLNSGSCVDGLGYRLVYWRHDYKCHPHLGQEPPDCDSIVSVYDRRTRSETSSGLFGSDAIVVSFLSDMMSNVLRSTSTIFFAKRDILICNESRIHDLPIDRRKTHDCRSFCIYLCRGLLFVLRVLWFPSSNPTTVFGYSRRLGSQRD